jgi:subtilisin family serine protease
MQSRKFWLAGVLFVLVLALAGPASAAPGGPTAPVVGLNATNAIPGSYIVVMKAGAPAAATAGAIAEAERAADAAAAAAPSAQGADAPGRSVSVQHRYDAALNGFAAQMPAAAVEALRHNPNVEYIEADQTVTIDATQTGATWGLDRIDQTSRPLNGSYIYDYTGAAVTAYIIDTGIYTSHSDFGGRASVGADFVGDGRNGIDCNGHGTHVAGTVGGAKYGVAKGVTLKAVRVLNCSGSGSNSGVIAGVNWVTSHHSGPSVANMSLGGGASSALDTAVANSIASGVTYAIAAGNSNANACSYSPARVAAAITVGATTSTDARASYSNYGTCLDLFAPGSSITSDWYGSSTATNTISGTSMATPHVTGAAALYLQHHTTASASTVRNALVNAATAGKVTSAGTGSPNRLLYSRVP